MPSRAGSAQTACTRRGVALPRLRRPPIWLRPACPDAPTSSCLDNSHHRSLFLSWRHSLAHGQRNVVQVQILAPYCPRGARLTDQTTADVIEKDAIVCRIGFSDALSLR